MNLEKYDKYRVVSSSDVSEIKGDFISIKKRLYKLKSGVEFMREEIIKNGGASDAVIVLALTPDNKVILTLQPRVHKKDAISLELPAGYIDLGESSIEAAKRELLEETGYSTNNFEKITGYYQDQGCSKVFNECFIAKDCVKVDSQSLDHDEYIEVVLVDYCEVLDLLDDGLINDAGSVITLLKSKSYLK